MWEKVKGAKMKELGDRQGGEGGVRMSAKGRA